MAPLSSLLLCLGVSHLVSVFGFCKSLSSHIFGFVSHSVRVSSHLVLLELLQESVAFDHHPGSSLQLVKRVLLLLQPDEQTMEGILETQALHPGHL